MPDSCFCKIAHLTQASGDVVSFRKSQHTPKGTAWLWNQQQVTQVMPGCSRSPSPSSLPLAFPKRCLLSAPAPDGSIESTESAARGECGGAERRLGLGEGVELLGVHGHCHHGPRASLLVLCLFFLFFPPRGSGSNHFSRIVFFSAFFRIGQVSQLKLQWHHVLGPTVPPRAGFGVCFFTSVSASARGRVVGGVHTGRRSTACALD